MLKLYLVTLLSFVFVFTPKAQTTIVLDAAKDNTIYQESTSNSNGIGQNFFSGTTAQSKPRRALIKFDIAAQVPAGATITSVTLTLFCNKTNSGNHDINIHQLLADWGQGSSDAANEEGKGILATLNDATWDNRFHPSTAWNLPGGDFSSTPTATTSVGSAISNYSWTSSQAIADVQNWLNNPNTNFGWILIGNEATSGSAKRFASLENPTSANRPQLSVTYTIPAIYTFTGTGAWSDATQWSNNSAPPTSLPANAEIIIDPVSTGECVLDVAQTILPGGKITVRADKKFRITGDLIVQ